MLINSINWIWIIFVTYVCGYAVTKAGKVFFNIQSEHVDVVMVAGMVFVNIYAEIFSLFYRVGVIASVGLGLITVICLVILGKEILTSLKKNQILMCKTGKIRYAVCAGALLAYLINSSCQPYLGDTYLYHIQAIEWIERYGIVKGLGNLQFRFAYNSAFECLQAVFSWSSILGRSLHTVNALYASLLTVYCTMTIHPLQKLLHGVKVSDLLKIVSVIYMLSRFVSYGAPDTDPLVMICISYIFIKWFEFIEKDEKDPAAYGGLCLLAIYSCTLKLSAGLVILLTFYPLVKLLKSKQLKKVLYFCFAGAVIVVPYLIRNVIISGYLLYPYASLDLFNFDWKIPASIANYDRSGIILWGRGLQNTEGASVSWTIMKWLPIWFSNLSILLKMIFLIDVFLVILFVFRIGKYIWKKKRANKEDFIIGISILCFEFWLLTAPLIRYGSLYMLIMLVAVLGTYYHSISRWIAGVGVVAICFQLYLLAGFDSSTCGIIIPADYREDFWVVGHEMPIMYADGSQVIIYTAKDGGMSNYKNFPETSEEEAVKNLQFRGNKIEDGFRSGLKE